MSIASDKCAEPSEETSNRSGELGAAATESGSERADVEAKNSDARETLRSMIWRVVTGHGMQGTERLRFVMGWAACVFAIATFIVIGWGTHCYLPNHREDLKTLVLPFLALWTIAPPMFFWFDYFVLWHLEKMHKTSQFADLSEFKHGQELSRNLWLAIVAILAAIYASK
jgi:hypothetical protein